MDHYLPWCLSHRNDMFNLVLACERCNKAKGDRLPWPLVWVLLAAYGIGQEGITPPVTAGVTQVKAVTPVNQAHADTTTETPTPSPGRASAVRVVNAVGRKVNTANSGVNAASGDVNASTEPVNTVSGDVNAVDGLGVAA